MKSLFNTITRRDLLSGSGIAAGAAVFGLPLVAGAVADQKSPSQRQLKVIVAGAHPDDPETGCGGTLARYADLGHDVAVLYLTRGEAGIRGKSHDQAAAIRTAEAKKACEILKARPLFAGQIDGSTEVNAARYDAFYKILEAEKPDIVFTHWPVDTHRDHRATPLLVYDAWLKAGKKFALYYFEVMTGSQTQTFRPTDYVDISRTESRKRKACFAHESQGPQHFYPRHEEMSRFRGLEHGCKHAEAFIHHVQSQPGESPLGA